MTTGAIGDERPTLFLRKATGLVRGWSVRDSMIYACLSTNVVTLGLVEFAYQDAFPRGQLLTAVLISGVWVSFLVIAYSGLVVTIPRAGGDYIWQSRILGSGLGFVMAATGWWFILWLWAPIYGSVLSEEFFQPLWVAAGDPSGAAWFGTHTGTFVVTLITIALAGLLVALGMAGYAKVQRWCFFGGLLGFAVIVIILLVSSRSSFESSLNAETAKLFGMKNAYAATTAAAAKAGITPPSFGFGGPISQSMLLVPMLMFYLLWPNWGTTLYGEVRGASDFKRVFSGMFFGLWTTVILSVIFLALFAKTFGYDQDVRLCLLPGRQRDLAGGHRAAGLPVPGAAGQLAGEQHRVPGDSHPADEPVVLRLGGDAVPVLDPGDLRRRLRPDPARRRGAGVGEAPGARMVADADAAARGRAGRAVRL